MTNPTIEEILTTMDANDRLRGWSMMIRAAIAAEEKLETSVYIRVDVFCECGERLWDVTIQPYPQSSRQKMVVRPCLSCILSLMKEIDLNEDKIESLENELNLLKEESHE